MPKKRLAAGERVPPRGRTSEGERPPPAATTEAAEDEDALGGVGGTVKNSGDLGGVAERTEEAEPLRRAAKSAAKEGTGMLSMAQRSAASWSSAYLRTVCTIDSAYKKA